MVFQRIGATWWLYGDAATVHGAATTQWFFGEAARWLSCDATVSGSYLVPKVYRKQDFI